MVSEQIRAQYRLERDLAARLMQAAPAQRLRLYSAVYRTFFDHFPPPPVSEEAIRLQVQVLQPFLHAGTTFLEIGAGQGAVAARVAEQVGTVYAVEPAAMLNPAPEAATAVRWVSAEALPEALPPASIDLAYSCHVIEHLHPDDALAQTRMIRRLLKPEGAYLCVTPNALHGPHDVSKHFDQNPTGLHLREYTYRSLAALLYTAGFKKVRVLRGVGRPPGLRLLWPYRVLESGLQRLPRSVRLALLHRIGKAPFRPLEQVVLLAR